MKKYFFTLVALFISNYILAQPKDTATEKTIAIKLNGVTIEGNLISTNNKQKLVIIVAGSGPTDRDGNNPLGVSSNSYKMLAKDLAKNNIASFRFDKRAVGKSAIKNFNESNLSFEDYINDAVSIFNYLKDTLGFKKIFFAGHSEGSLVTMIASEKTNTKGYISISGAGRAIDKIIVEQYAKQSVVVSKKIDSLFEELKTKNKIDSVPKYLQSIFRPSVQPYLLSWMKYNPPTEINKLKIPILILQGSCDIQVSVADANSLHDGNKKSTLIIVEGMTHTLKNAEANCKDDNRKTYLDASLPLNTQFVKKIINFVEKN